MPQNKNHHYVPQFYLRNFGTGESIALLNIKRHQHFTRAPISGQCQREYYYGRDDVLDAKLRAVEGPAFNAIQSIIHGDLLPPRESPEYLALITFISFQLGRTPSAELIARETQQKAIAATVKGMLALRGEVDDEGISQEVAQSLMAKGTAPLVQSLDISETTTSLILDLQPKLLVLDHFQQFVTSDCPVVLFNPWCAGYKAGGVVGLANSGLLVILPLSPRHILILVDSEVYSLGADDETTISIDHRDVKGLNSLQLLTAEHNIYYRDSTEGRAIADDLPLRWHKPRTSYIRVHRAYSNEDGSTLVYFYQQQPDFRLELRSLKVRRDRVAIPLRERARTWRSKSVAAERALDKRERPSRPGIPGQTWRVIERS
jgi:hypothetical protein